jgi:hypothetical protein
MKHYTAIIIALLLCTNIAALLAVRGSQKAKAEAEDLHQAACQELNELRATIAAGATVTF